MKGNTVLRLLVAVLALPACDRGMPQPTGGKPAQPVDLASATQGSAEGTAEPPGSWEEAAFRYAQIFEQSAAEPTWSATEGARLSGKADFPVASVDCRGWVCRITMESSEASVPDVVGVATRHELFLGRQFAVFTDTNSGKTLIYMSKQGYALPTAAKTTPKQAGSTAAQ